MTHLMKAAIGALALAGLNLSASAEAPAAEAAQTAVSAYSFTLPNLDGGDLDFSQFAGKPMLVVNTASKCGYTPQYEGLQALHEAYEAQGLVVVGIPSQDFGGQEYDDASQTKEFCDLEYGVTFPMTVRQHVKGEDAHPFYKWAHDTYGDEAVPKWNFHKILIGRDGAPVAAYGSRVTPQDETLTADIEAQL